MNEQAAFEHIRAGAREAEPDRYLAALLAPKPLRADLIVLAAFAGEVRAIAQQTREPMLGEIRVQWWRDALFGAEPGAKSGHPVADAFAAVMARHNLPRVTIEDFLDATVHTLYPAPPADAAALDLELRLTEGALFELAARILGVDCAARAVRDALDAAARAYGLARVGLAMPHALARGREPLPFDGADNPFIAAPDRVAQIAELTAQARVALAACKPAFAGAAKGLRTALLPLALVEPYLRVLQKPQHVPDRDLADVAPLARVWAIARAHYQGRI